MDFLTTWDADNLRADWAMGANDLASDGGLKSAVLISLFTDRLAAADDELPAGDGDRRGWWGDLPISDAASSVTPRYLGSRLWLLRRAKQLPRTLQRAVAYCQEALQPLIDAGVAQKIDVRAQFQGAPGFMAAVIIITRQVAGRLVDERYDLLWQVTIAP